MNSLQVIQQAIVILLFLFKKLLRMNFACIMLRVVGLLKKLRYNVAFQDLIPNLARPAPFCCDPSPLVFVKF